MKKCLIFALTLLSSFCSGAEVEWESLRNAQCTVVFNFDNTSETYKTLGDLSVLPVEILNAIACRKDNNPLVLNRINKACNNASIFKTQKNICVDLDMPNDTSDVTNSIAKKDCKFSDQTTLVASLVAQGRLKFTCLFKVKNFKFRDGKHYCKLTEYPEADGPSKFEFFGLLCFFEKMKTDEKLHRNSVISLATLARHKEIRNDIRFIWLSEPLLQNQYNLVVDVQNIGSISFNADLMSYESPEYYKHIFNIGGLLSQNLCHSLQKVSLSNFASVIQDAEEISYGLAESTTIKTLELNNVSLNNTILQILACGLQLNKSLRKLYITNMSGFSMQGLYYLADALAMHASIKKIRLKENYDHDNLNNNYGLKILFEMLQKNEKVKKDIAIQYSKISILRYF